MKVAVLGAGEMGATVIEHLSKLDLVSESIAYDIRPSRVEKLKGMGIKATADLQGILDDPEVKVVFVTSSNDSHKELVLRSLAAGKATMTEKPIANTLSDASEMVEASERLGVFFQVGFELRYSKLYTKIKDWIDAGLLGNVVNSNCYYIASVWNKGIWRNQKETCGGMFGEKLSHYVDLPRWWIGSPVVDVTSYSAPNTVPYFEIRDNYHTSYRFANGAVSHLTFMMGPAAHFDGDPLRDMIEQQKDDGHILRYLVVGTKGAAEGDVFRRTLKRWAFSDHPEYMNSQLVQTQTWDAKEDHFYFHCTTDQTKDIVWRVHEGLPPKTSARDALETMKLCFAAEKSSDLARTVKLDEELENYSV